MDLWFATLGIATVAGGVLGAGWLSARITRPLRKLAEVSLSGLDARQVNHDLKNGLIPIRNVVRHLAQVARDEPARLPAVLLERRGTLESGISYLENLTRKGGRPSPAGLCDVNAVVADLVAGHAGVAGIRTELATSLPPVAADPVVIRRIVENLVNNATASFRGRENGRVIVSTSGGRVVLIGVADTGCGMTAPELEQAFQGGSGLGLSIVRRLVLDLNGTLRVETSPGWGTRCTVELPAVDA